MNIQHRKLNVGRLQLHVAELGEGPAVLLLHGFPAHWAAWRDQMEALAARGFRAIAPDLPGYGESDRLPHMLDYRSTLLAADLAGLVRALGLPKVHVIGHDWGGMLAYCLAAQHPELVDRLVVLNAGHPELFRRALRHFDQLRRSWYILLFQLPWLPEWLVQRRAVIALCTRDMAVNPHAFSEADVDQQVRVMRLPGVARATLSYYRAALRSPVRAPGVLTQRTLVLWGDQDSALSAELLLTDLARYVPDLRVARFANGGHWLHRDQPEVVSRHVIQFLSAAPSAAP